MADNLQMWHMYGSTIIHVEIAAETPHQAAEQFRRVNGYLPESVESDVRGYVVMGECERCSRVILDSDGYGQCDIDSTYLCQECLEETTEPVNDEE